MIRIIRYSLASFFVTASVGCLALWWRSYRASDFVAIPLLASSTRSCGVNTYLGRFAIFTCRLTATPSNADIYYADVPRTDARAKVQQTTIRPQRFGRMDGGFYFPIWYAALIFALAGIATLRLGRRFTLRSAIIATTVMAGLLGMAVGL